jgi:hypothetical protein
MFVWISGSQPATWHHPADFAKKAAGTSAAEGLRF